MSKTKGVDVKCLLLVLSHKKEVRIRVGADIVVVLAGGQSFVVTEEIRPFFFFARYGLSSSSTLPSPSPGVDRMGVSGKWVPRGLLLFDTGTRPWSGSRLWGRDRLPKERAQVVPGHDISSGPPFGERGHGPPQRPSSSSESWSKTDFSTGYRPTKAGVKLFVLSTRHCSPTVRDKTLSFLLLPLFVFSHHSVRVGEEGKSNYLSLRVIQQV